MTVEEEVEDGSNTPSTAPCGPLEPLQLLSCQSEESKNMTKSGEKYYQSSSFHKEYNPPGLSPFLQ